jgi:4-amino-4-deoxy-L-arabinose transferase-like glycosyltransferase
MRRMTYAGLSLIVLASTLLAAGTWPVYSHTWDEPEHLAAGVELLDRGRYEYDTEHPPLARVLIALGPYLAGARSYATPPPDGVIEGTDILYGSGHYGLYLTLARLGTLPFLALLLAATWLWARRVFESNAQALLAVALLASVPPILGHAALATLDVPAAATTLLALYMVQRWLIYGSLRDAVLLGLTAGIAIGTKFSAVPFVGLGALGLAAIRAGLRYRSADPNPRESLLSDASKTHQPNTRLLGFVVTAAALSAPIIVAYGLHSVEIEPLPRQFDWMLGYLLHDHLRGHDSLWRLTHVLRLPGTLWDLVEGIVRLKAHNESGHFSYLLGQERSSGWWYFYLVALAAKTPVPLIAMGPVGLALMLRDGWRLRNPWRVAPAVLFVTILTFASAYSHINIGVRHVLVLYPFLALGAAWAFIRAWESLESAAGRWACGGKVLLSAIATWQVGALCTAYPDCLPYFNEVIAHPEQVLVDSDLDWGQDLRRLEQRLQELNVHKVNLAYLGTADLAREALPQVTLLHPMQVVTGWVAVTALAREHSLGGYAWLDGFRPVQRIGKTIDLYYIP